MYFSDAFLFSGIVATRWLLSKPFGSKPAILPIIIDTVLATDILFRGRMHSGRKVTQPYMQFSRYNLIGIRNLSATLEYVAFYVTPIGVLILSA